MALTVIPGAGPALGQGGSSRCADCHFANPQNDPAPYHLNEWARSPHGRAGVGCDACHGGNPDTFEAFIAHQGILGTRNPASPVHWTNLPRTCGTCHTGPFVAFQASGHFDLLGQGARGMPTCVTCHEAAGAELLSPRGLERQCAACHGPEGIAPREGRAEQARFLQESIAAVRESLEVAEQLIERVDEPVRRGQLEERYNQAEVPLIEATQAGHRFIFDGLRERLEVARERAVDLLQELANSVR